MYKNGEKSYDKKFSKIKFHIKFVLWNQVIHTTTCYQNDITSISKCSRTHIFQLKDHISKFYAKEKMGRKGKMVLWYWDSLKEKVELVNSFSLLKIKMMYVLYKNFGSISSNCLPF